MAHTFKKRDHCPSCGTQIGSAVHLGERLDRAVGLKVNKRLGKGLPILKCKHCGLIFPADIIVFEENIFTKTQSGTFPAFSEVPYKGSFERELNLMEGFFKRPLKELDALDAGFGYGNSLLPMKERFRSVKGIEPFKEIFQYAVLHPELKGLKGDLINVDFDQAQYPDTSFDFIFLEAFQHLQEPDIALKKAMKWLKKDGLIYMEVPSSGWLIAKLVNLIYYLQRTNYVCNLSPLHGHYSFTELSRRTLELNGQKNNYKVIYHEIYPCNTGLNQWLDKILKLVMKLTGTGMQMGIVLKKLN